MEVTHERRSSVNFGVRGGVVETLIGHENDSAEGHIWWTYQL
jgi:hypothetical protein